MAKLECHVNSCANYSANYCCLPNIQVSGAMAFHSEQTCCSSYVSQHTAAFSNAVGSSIPNESLSIDCSAENCTYNAGRSCAASNVCISGSGAAKKGETCCLTFHQS